jgi:membrane-associated phospholipid phosphatase
MPRGPCDATVRFFHWLIFLPPAARHALSFPADRMRRIKIALLFVLLSPALAHAGSVNLTPLTSSEKNIESLGTAVAIALPVTAAGISYFKHDRMGLAQLTVVTAMTVGTAYALKEIVREERPDGSDFHSFPSAQTALAASGSAYLWGRYGWQYGLPAFFASQFVSYSRVQARQHHWYDTLASSAIAAGYSYVLTTRFRPVPGLRTSLSSTPEGARFNLSYAF